MAEKSHEEWRQEHIRRNIQEADTLITFLLTNEGKSVAGLSVAAQASEKSERACNLRDALSDYLEYLDKIGR